MALLDETQDLATACGLVLNRHLKVMLARERGARDGDDIEDLHLMRVALRKLRAALVVFRGAISKNESKLLNRELSRVGDALGAVRDLDVFIDRMDVTRAELDDRSAQWLNEVNSVIERRRQLARETMLEALNDDKYSVFIAGLRRRIEVHDPALFSGPVADQPLLNASAELLRRFVRRAVSALKKLDDGSSAAALHAARKKVRRLRYGLDFLGGLHGRPAKRLRKQAKRIQDLLGEHQDAMIAQDVLWSVAEEMWVEGTASAETYVAIGQAIEREVRHAETARAQFFAERGELCKLARKFETAIRREA